MRLAHIRVAKTSLEKPDSNHYIMCMMIFDALQDLKDAALSGEALNYAEVAKDYGLNPALLERKFKESYPNGVSALKSEKEMIAEKVAETVARLCSKYGVPMSDTKVREVRGVRYTVIGRFAGSKKYHYSAVSHKDGRAWRLASV